MNLHRIQPSGLGPFLSDAEPHVTTLDNPPMTPPIQPTKPGAAAPINISQTFAAVGTLANAIVNGFMPSPQEASEIFSSILLMKNALKVIGVDLAKDDREMTPVEVERRIRDAYATRVSAVDEPTTLAAIAASTTTNPAIRKLARDIIAVKAMAAEAGVKIDEKPKVDWSKSPTQSEKTEALAALGIHPRKEST